MDIDNTFKEPKTYVLGFAFDLAITEVILIAKNRPEWQKDKLNGIGGKIEPGETAKDAIVREFFEETGVMTYPDFWNYFADVKYDNDPLGGPAIIYCFRFFSDIMFECKTMEDEEIIKFDLAHPHYEYCVRTVPALIPIAADLKFKFAALNMLY